MDVSQSPVGGQARSHKADPNAKRQPKAKNKADRLDDDASARVVVASARVHALPDRDILRSLEPFWQDGANVAATEGSEGINGWLKAESVRLKDDPARFDAIESAIARARIVPEPAGELPAMILPIQNEQARSRRFDVYSEDAFAALEFKTEFLVEGILVADQPCILAAPKKSMKTSVVVDLAVSIASGLSFLGRFGTKQSPVLLMSGESGGGTLQDTIRRVMESKGMKPGQLGSNLTVSLELPRLSRSEDIGELQEIIRERGIKVVIIDPLYLCLLSGTEGRALDPANLFDVGPLLLAVSRACIEAGATPVLLHHFRKSGGDPYERPELESIAYAGTQEFARQWILFARRSRYDPGTGKHELWMTVGGSAGHSGEYAVDIEEGVVGSDFSSRHWTVATRYASEEFRQAGEQSAVAKAEKAIARNQIADAERERTAAFDASQVLMELTSRGPKTRTALRETMRWNSDRLGRALAYLEHDGSIETCDIERSNRHGIRTIPDGGIRAKNLPKSDANSLTRTNPD